MKKALSIVVLSLFVSVAMFAAGYKVTSVTGKVTYEAAPGEWKNVSVGQELSASTVINTSLNSNVVLLVDDNSVTIKAMSKGSVDSLVSSASNGVAKKKAGGVKKSNYADVEGSSKGTATASSRASEAKEDVAWDE